MEPFSNAPAVVLFAAGIALVFMEVGFQGKCTGNLED